MIPPGQPGLSQQAVDLSQPCATPVSSWQPPRASMTTPRPAVQGYGMAGMMRQFPSPPPSWGQQTQAWPRPSQYGQNAPTPPRTPSQPRFDSTFARKPSTGCKTMSGRIPTIPFGQHWKSDEEFYDNQKVNGLPLPRAIRSSSWSE